jgi:hypothetical protein
MFLIQFYQIEKMDLVKFSTIVQLPSAISASSSAAVANKNFNILCRKAFIIDSRYGLFKAAGKT